MKYGCLFSGVGCSSLAFDPLGWDCEFHAELEPFACAVLRHHWPEVPNLGDITEVDWAQLRGKVDLLMGSPPCQAFSVAGDRGGVSDGRGNLSLQWAEVINEVDPEWSVTENVPGWLSSKDNAFGAFLGRAVGADAPLVPPGGRWRSAGVVAGPARVAAWRVLDAQHFGVPHRRKRVFVVTGRVGAGADPVPVLFERQGLHRDSSASCVERQGTTNPHQGGTGTRSGKREVADPLTANEARTQSHAGNNPRTRNVVVSWCPVQGTSPTNGTRFDSDVSHCLARDNAARAIVTTQLPRRFTVTECERLQGMPDGHTQVPYRGKSAADQPRYRAIGNAIAVPVLRWIAERIEKQTQARKECERK